MIDFGTATTFDCVEHARRVRGGAIAPGLATSVDALLSRAARLYRVELVRPPAAIGRNTITNIQSGVIYGYAGSGGRARRAHARRDDGSPRVVATGGHAALIADATRSIEIVNPDLTLEGLRMLFERVQHRKARVLVDRSGPTGYTPRNIVASRRYIPISGDRWPEHGGTKEGRPMGMWVGRGRKARARTASMTSRWFPGP